MTVFVLLAAAAWIGGLLWFAATLDRPAAQPGRPTDAIVVLTGGSRRVERGVDLLAEGHAKKLFISGVHPGVTLNELLQRQASSDVMRCCIELGHDAENTIENAIETRRWMQSHGFHSLRLVTSNYHMRRSLLEFRRVMPPDIEIVPQPVVQTTGAEAPHGLWRGSEKLVLTEYMKFLAAWLRPLWQGDPAA